MGRPHPLYSWSINPIHFQLKTPKDDLFLMSSFETDLSKIQIAVFLKVLVENILFFFQNVLFLLSIMIIVNF